MAAKDDYLVDLLVDMGHVSAEQLVPLREEAAANSEGLLDLLLSRKIVSPSNVAQAKASHFGNEFVNLANLRLPDDVIASIPRHVAKRYRAVPVSKHNNAIAVALADPSDLDAIDSLQRMVNAEIELRVATDEDIEAALNKYYGAADDSVSNMIQEITEGEVDITAAKKQMGDDGAIVEADAPIIKLVNMLIVEAFRARASDIHLEPLSKTFRVRYRIDGMLHEMKSPPKRLQAAIISRIKIQSAMSIAERRIPQDGRIQTSVGGKLIDLRVSCIPTNHGEIIVMRISD